MQRIHIKQWAVLACVLGLLYVDLTRTQSVALGVLVFSFYLFVVGSWWRDLLNAIFRMQWGSVVTYIFAVSTTFFLLGFGASVLTVWYKLSSEGIWWIYVVVAVVSFILLTASQKMGYTKEKELSPPVSRWVLVSIVHKKHFFLIILCLAGLLLGFFMLFQSRSTEVLFSPWQTIHHYFLPLYALLSVLLGVLIFSKERTTQVLFLLVLFSLLGHSYLSLSHINPWGGDVWRHLAVEQKLASGDMVLPVLFGNEARWREVLGVDVPEALVIPNKYAYGHLWGMSVLVSQTLHLDLIAINIWLIPILWSLLFPLIFFRFGKLLFGSWRTGLLLAWLSTIPFPLQALGALSLPNSLGFLVFLFVLMLWIQYVQERGIWQRRIVLLLSVLMLFGYSLYALLIWAVLLLTFLTTTISNLHNPMVRKSGFTTLTLLSVFFFPLVEILTHFSFVPEYIPLWNNIKQAIGELSGWFYASAIRPHDIVSGNILFNHTPDFAFVSSLFTDWRWHILVGTVAIWTVVKLGIVHLLRNEQSIVWRVLATLGVCAVGGYLIGWYLLSGDRLFVRRLDPMIAFLVVLFFVYGISRVRASWFVWFHRIRVLLIVLSLVFAGWYATTTYASGPDMQVASEDDVRVSKYIWEEENKEASSFCVLADTWTLLVLEGISLQHIVGGGFPIDAQFAQPERTVLYSEIVAHPRPSVMTQSKEKTGASHCWVVVPIDSLSEAHETNMRALSDQPPEQFGDLVVWKISHETKNTAE